MTIQISVSNQIESRLRQKAGAVNKDLSSYVIDTLEEKIADQGEAAAMARSTELPPEQWVIEFQQWLAN